jgi:hypothetical protein
MYSKTSCRNAGDAAAGGCAGKFIGLYQTAVAYCRNAPQWRVPTLAGNPFERGVEARFCTCLFMPIDGMAIQALVRGFAQVDRKLHPGVRPFHVLFEYGLEQFRHKVDRSHVVLVFLYFEIEFPGQMLKGFVPKFIQVKGRMHRAKVRNVIRTA